MPRGPCHRVYIGYRRYSFLCSKGKLVSRRRSRRAILRITLGRCLSIYVDSRSVLPTDPTRSHVRPISDANAIYADIPRDLNSVYIQRLSAASDVASAFRRFVCALASSRMGNADEWMRIYRRRMEWESSAANYPCRRRSRFVISGVGDCGSVCVRAVKGKRREL